jgi:putative NADH-flavin reductase
MKIAVFGATGATGQRVVQQALDKGWEVQALARKPEALTISDPKLTVVKGDARDADAVAQTVAGAGAVVSTIGLPKGIETDTSLSDSMRTICEAMTSAGVARLVAMSVLGLRDSADKAGIFGRLILPVFMKKSVADRVRLEEAVEASGLDYTLVRASRLTDADATGSYKAGPAQKAKGTSKTTRGDAAACMLDQAEAQGEHERAIGVIS